MTRHILIVEDEPVVAKRLARLLSELPESRHASIEFARSLDGAFAQLEQQRCDLMLLDLDLSGRDGFDLLAAAVAGPQQTIVVSANTDRALEAFEYGVVDFVPKPFDRARLRKALSRIATNKVRPKGRARVLSFREGNRTRLVEIKRIRAVHGADQYAEVELEDGQRLLHEKTLDQLQDVLPERYMRVHRSHILDLGRISALENEPGSRYFARMDNGERIPVSRREIAALRARLH